MNDPQEKTIVKCWRDLELGEKILPGDRFIDSDGKWITVSPSHLDFENTITSYARVHQRNISVSEEYMEILQDGVCRAINGRLNGFAREELAKEFLAANYEGGVLSLSALEKNKR